MAANERPYIFIDTCSLLESCWNRTSGTGGEERFDYSKSKDEMFWGRQFASLVSMGDVIIPKRNYEELVKHSRNNARPDLASRAKHVLQKIATLHREGKIQIVGDENDPFADAILLSVALKFRTQKNMAFITQDRKLSEDLESIRHFKSVDNRNGYDIKIRRISKSGALEEQRGLGTHKHREHKHEFDRARPVQETEKPKTTSSKGWWES